MRGTKMNRINAISYCVLLLSFGCGGKPIAASPAPVSVAPAPTVSATPILPAAPVAKPLAAPPAAAPGPKPVLEIKEGLSTPESVFYDETQDRYLISNIN